MNVTAKYTEIVKQIEIWQEQIAMAKLDNQVDWVDAVELNGVLRTARQDIIKLQLKKMN